MRILHTMIRVSNLDRSIEFYTQVLGMKLIRTSENPQYRYTLAFVGYGEESSETVLELTYNWDINQYEHGNAFGHLALETDDIYATCAAIKAKGGNVSREPGPVKGGSTIIAFIKDPDGYSIELINKKDTSENIKTS